MTHGVSGVTLPTGFPYKAIIESACAVDNLPPCLVGAIKMNETGLGFGPHTEQDISRDGGHGIMQLTSSYPSDWRDPAANIGYAIAHFILPDWEAWTTSPYLLTGDNLVRAVAAAYNDGLGTAERDHAFYGNVDRSTTNHYAARALAHYQSLSRGVIA